MRQLSRPKSTSQQRRPNSGSEKRNTFSPPAAGDKVLSLKHLKELIADIFDSKFKHDQRCQEVQVPLETMEQFLYTYLAKKYGLKVSSHMIIRI